MKRQAVIFIFLLILSGMTSCNLPVPSVTGQENQEVSQQYSTVSALLTKTALGTAAPDGSGAAPSQTSVVKGTSLLAATPESTSAQDTPAGLEKTPQAPAGKAMTVPCALARPGHPMDITVPDDTRFYPGEYFSKTWRLVNAGSCEWTSDYAVVWFSGDSLGISHSQPFLSNVGPGGSVEITVEMVAPQRSGTYQSNWKLRDTQGQLFGIGPNGDSPFWVRIVVVPLFTPTVTPTTPITTPTPLVFASGTLILDLDQRVDLDSGKAGAEENDDLVLAQPEEEGFFIAPENDARFLPFGNDAPGLQDCSLAELSGAPIDLQQVLVGSYLCYRTNQGLPGRIYLAGVDLEDNIIDLEFVTWAVP